MVNLLANGIYGIGMKRCNLINQMFKLSFRYYVSLSNKEYQTLADKTLENILDFIDYDQIESSLSQGVLKFNIDSKSWVLNKQTPNKQIWWSSPISGPLRFEYHGVVNDTNVSTLVSKWKCTRDNTILIDRLREEILKVTKIDILNDNK